MQVQQSRKYWLSNLAPIMVCLCVFGCGTTEQQPSTVTQVSQIPNQYTPPESTTGQQPTTEIQLSQAPGQYDVLQGTAVQLSAQNQRSNPQVKSYQWSIIEGRGGTLLNADSATVTFSAPQIQSDIELFTIKLTTGFIDGTSSSARMTVRVHKRPPQTAPTTVVEKRYVTERLYGFNPWYTGALGFGFGYVWNYPIYVPIYIPVPYDDLGPEDLLAINPEPLSADEISKLPDDLRPETILPEDVDFPDATPLPSEVAGTLPEAEPASELESAPLDEMPPDSQPVVEPVPSHEQEALPEALPEPMPEPAIEPMPAPMIEPVPDIPMDMGGFE